MFTNTSDAYHHLNFLSLDEIYRIKCCEFIYKSINGNRIILQDYLSKYRYDHNYHTRRMESFKLPKVRLATHHTFFIYNSIKFWNELDDELKISSSVNVLNNHLREQMVSFGVIPAVDFGRN